MNTVIGWVPAASLKKSSFTVVVVLVFWFRIRELLPLVVLMVYAPTAEPQARFPTVR